MRKITQEAKWHFENRVPFNKSNTCVSVGISGNVYLSLHGNLIASRVTFLNELHFSLCGWNTPTTRERLKAVGISICTIKAQAYYISGNDKIPIDDYKKYAILENGTLQEV